MQQEYDIGPGTTRGPASHPWAVQDNQSPQKVPMSPYNNSNTEAASGTESSHQVLSITSKKATFTQVMGSIKILGVEKETNFSNHRPRSQKKHVGADLKRAQFPDET